MKKTLILLRHAKAEAGQDDHARPLAARGIKEAEAMGAYMAKHGISPQKILCSTSTRTRQTLENISPLPLREGRGGGVVPNTQTSSVRQSPPTLILPLKGGGNSEVEFSKATYNASETQHLQNIAAQSEDISSLMIIAHNPGLHQLAIHVSREGDAAQLRTLAMEFPPCSLVVIELGDIPWRDIFTVRGKLKLFVTPKTI